MHVAIILKTYQLFHPFWVDFPMLEESLRKG
jgi:hypothetical protein